MDAAGARPRNRWLKATATDLGPAGVDNKTGAGLVNAWDAIFGPAVAATANFTDDFEGGFLSNNWETHSYGAGRMHVAQSEANGGQYSLQMDAFDGLGRNGLNEAILHFDATVGSGAITLATLMLSAAVSGADWPI